MRGTGGDGAGAELSVTGNVGCVVTGATRGPERKTIRGGAYLLHAAEAAEDGRVRALDPRDHPVLQLDERATLLNPGSVGQPRDGDPRASWALLDTSAQTVAWRRVAYDIPAVQARMSAAGLPAPLISRLAFGH